VSLVCNFASNRFVGNSSKEFRENRKVKDERRGQKRVLAFIEDVQSVPSTHQQFGMVLVDGPFAVAHSRNIFDDDNMVRMLSFLLALALVRGLVQESIGINHVIYHAALANLLALELPFRA